MTNARTSSQCRLIASMYRDHGIPSGSPEPFSVGGGPCHSATESGCRVAMEKSGGMERTLILKDNGEMEIGAEPRSAAPSQRKSLPIPIVFCCNELRELTERTCCGDATVEYNRHHTPVISLGGENLRRRRLAVFGARRSV